jgi:predicted O-methyltransferase YrrM
LDAFLSREPARAATVGVPWDTPRVLEFIDLAIQHKLWLLADHLLTHLGRRRPLTRDEATIATRVRNLKATLFVQVSQLPADAPMAIAIDRYVRELRPQVILDVGAATGLGTTVMFSRAAQAAGVDSVIYAMEAEPATFELLKRNTAGLSNVRPQLSSLITDQDVSPWAAVMADIRQRSRLLEQFAAEEIQQWYAHGVEVLRQLRLEGKAPFAELPATIDMAMIDADLFFAREELSAILGRTTLIMLDDVCAYKNASNHEMLAASPEWEMLDYQPADRHGWSAFRRR